VKLDFIVSHSSAGHSFEHAADGTLLENDGNRCYCSLTVAER